MKFKPPDGNHAACRCYGPRKSGRDTVAAKRKNDNIHCGGAACVYS